MVGRGQSVYVTNRDLQFNVPENQDPCKVEVVLNEPATQQVGKLKPQVFDCHFFPEEVKYTHNGCPILEEDNVMMRIYRFTETETLMETFLLKVRVSEPEAGLVCFGTVALEVPEFYGVSNPIDKEVVSFRYNAERSGTVCTVRILPPEALVPAHGQIITDVPQYPRGRSLDAGINNDQRTVRQTGLLCAGNKACPAGAKEVRFLKADCEHFLTMGLKYQHLSPPSPDVDYIPITVEIRDEKSRLQLQVENAWIPVKIKGGIPNQRPKAAFMSMFILELDQFILTPLSTAALDATDDESPKHRLFFKITKPPEEGYITHLEDHTKPITSFTWQDLHEMKIAYQPPNISHTERRNYEVDFKAVDVFFLDSAPIMVHFSIRTAETNAPRVSWNMGLDLLEGQSRSITWENLQIVDNDNINAVRLVTVEGLQHGRLTVRDGKGFLFTVRDIKDGVVRYHHDDSDTTKDYIVFRISDGKHVARHKFPVNILPKDDSPPFLINNLALQLAEGELLPIEDHMLLASDFDSSDDYILYRITHPPKAGDIVKKTVSDLPGLPVTSFLQRDLIHGLIYYRHSGGEIFEDSVVFVLSDSQEPPNLSDPQTMMVHVTPVKDQLPKEVIGTTRSLVVKETEIGYITEDHLHFTDTESPENELMYIVTKSCFFPFNRKRYDAGKIFFTGSVKNTKKDPSIPMLKSFTQHAVRHMKVAYMPPQGDLGPAPLLVQFVFSVTDQQGGTVTGLVFNITIMPVDDQPPEIFTNQIKAEEGSGCLITQANLMVTDRDTQDEDLRIQLQRRPEHGEVQVLGNVMWEGDMFTLQDLRSFQVRYQHDDSETLSDSMVFTATDGFNTADGVLTVKIIPINDEPPELGPRLKSALRCPEGEKVTITTEYLHATDMDSDDMRLNYMIARAPSYGAVQRGGVTVDKFSQLDISRGLISYWHTGGEIGYSSLVDTVTVIVSDGEAGTVDSCCYEGPLPPPIPLHGSLPVYDLNITILPVNNQPPAVHVGEMFVVDEGGKASLSERYLSATDKDTRPEELTFDLQSLPQFGYLENTLPSPGYEKSNAGINIVLFSLQHLKAGSINYVQARHEQMEPTADHFLVSVSDGMQESRAIPFYIIINPSNDEAPVLQVGNITVMEGDMCQIGPGTLSSADLDSPPDNLGFSVVRPPVHGKLLNALYGEEVVRYRQRSGDLLHRVLTVNSFSGEEIKRGLRLAYVHDGSETLRDSLTLQLTDGKHVVWGTLHINVTPVNDEMPVVLKNTGLEVDVGENKVISSVALEAEDRDTPRHKLHYIINSIPKFGQLQLKTQWQWMVVYPGMNFTQDDVDMNLVWYLHTTIVGSKGHDSFRFYVTDGENSSPPENFYISIKEMEKGDIVVLAKPVTLTEGDRVTLTTDVLLATDGTGKPEELLFAISVPPAHGQIQYINYPGLAVSSFSQLDVAAQKVCYVHDNSHEGSQDSFRFLVSNGLTVTNGSLQFIIEQTDHLPPVLISNKGLQVPEGATMIISPDTLRLTDPDTSSANLTFTITRPPHHGTLRLEGRVRSPERFTQLQVSNLDVSYKHDGQASGLDSFAFVASDGTNRGFMVNGQLREEPVTFTIQVEHTDKASPRILTNESPTVIDTLRDGRFGIYITARNLKASDVDSDDEELIFTVLRPPNFGYLENVNTGGYIRGTFTQSDIDRRRIRYIVNSSIEVISDSYEFKISDPAGNSIVPQVMELKWSRIEMAETLYRVCEDTGTLSIKVTRKGYSSDPSYISIQVQELSAIVDRDFTHSSASLIQFDPGVSTKVWNVFIKDDGLEENNEKFEVRLRTPINAILGQNDISLVEIVDLRGVGGCALIHPRMSEEDETHDGFEGAPHSNSRSPPDSRGKVFRQRGRAGMESEPDWDSFPSPPRGDVPQTDQLCDLQALTREEASPIVPRRQIHSIESGRTSREMVSVRIEERSVPGSNWRWPLFPFPLGSRQELPQQDASIPLEKAHSHDSNDKQSHKAKCPMGWTQNEKHCYLLNSWRNGTWEGGQTACSHMFHGNLVSVHSKKEMKWFSRFAQKQPIWIGLRAEVGSGRWEWTNGRPVTFTNWKKPKMWSMGGDVQSKCALAQGKGKWVVRPCSDHQVGGYICSISLV
ncbi:FRAS1-related extracellular matrix protein 1b [Callorhinchus milii]|uniref:FRAS1-related extracellular matrix protein 1b n=1 Tax=Callorhinchus milii TaxID=7868 RepID=UPI001C3F77EA|nr:FRAS1-related extracellular matrix protein 1b [Callorhinchus milii]